MMDLYKDSYPTGFSFKGIDQFLAWCEWDNTGWCYFGDCEEIQIAYYVADSNDWLTWRILALMILSNPVNEMIRNICEVKDNRGYQLKYEIIGDDKKSSWFTSDSCDAGTIHWCCNSTKYWPEKWIGKDPPYGYNWYRVHPLATLAHELYHAWDHAVGGISDKILDYRWEIGSMKEENYIREALYLKDPTQSNLFPRPGYRYHHFDLDPDYYYIDGNRICDIVRSWKEYIKLLSKKKAPIF